MKATTHIGIDQRRIKKDGTYPVKLRITYLREQRYFPTKFSLSKCDYEKLSGSKPRGKAKDIALELHALEKRAKDIIDDLQHFTWDGFTKKLQSNVGVSNYLSDSFSATIINLRSKGQIGTAVSYECAQKSFESFAPDCRFFDVTPEWLAKYERWMLATGKSITTVGIYARNLRTLFNEAISDGIIQRDLYPFGKRKYEIPQSNNIKKALSLSEIAAIFQYVPQDEASTEAMCVDLWKFLYLANGMNVKDLCLLKNKNVLDDSIEFIRAKTARTKRITESIKIPLIPELKEILNRRRSPGDSAHDYVFDVLTKGISPERERDLIQFQTRLINDHMRKVGDKLRITKPITTYVARHSFASVLMRAGESIALISGALGHSSIHTTQKYLASFEDDARIKAASSLTNFHHLKRVG